MGRLKCPFCTSKQTVIQRSNKTIARCDFCHQKFAVPEKKAKSGVIAGKVTVGRGARWGAGY